MQAIDHWVIVHEERIYNLQNLDYIEKYGNDGICLQSSKNIYYIKFRSKEIRDEYFDTLRRLLRARRL